MTSGALFLVKPIRSKNYVTLMDPFQEKYGNTVVAIIFIPALIADILWVACILGALGKSEQRLHEYISCKNLNPVKKKNLMN